MKVCANAAHISETVKRKACRGETTATQEDKTMIASTLAPEVVKRRKMERAICSALVKAGLEAGYTIGVYNGEETVIKNSTSHKAIMAELFSVDDHALRWRTRP